MKCCPVILLLFMPLLFWGQVVPKVRPGHSEGDTAQFDTLDLFSGRAKSIGCYRHFLGNGYMMGTAYDTVFTQSNELITDATGLYYDGVPKARVLEVLVLFCAAEIIGDPDVIVAKIYSTNPDSSPHTLLAYGSISSDQIIIDPTLYLTSIPISVGIADTKGKPFIVSVEYVDIDDTIGIYSYYVDSLKYPEQRTFQRMTYYFGGRWDYMWQLFQWTSDEPFYWTIVDTSGDIPDAVEEVSFLSGKPHPIPAIDQLFIPVELGYYSEITAGIYSTMGQLLFLQRQVLMAGKHELILPTELLNPGIYFARITMGVNSQSFKFIKAK